jgi:hypothetical protein
VSPMDVDICASLPSDRLISSITWPRSRRAGPRDPARSHVTQNVRYEPKFGGVGAVDGSRPGRSSILDQRGDASTHPARIHHPSTQPEPPTVVRSLGGRYRRLRVVDGVS